MIDKIKQGIALKLDEAFGLPIMTELTEQGFDEPCFFIKCLQSSEDSLMGRRYLRRNSFVVQFFPARDGNENASIDDKREMLYEVLGYVSVDGSPVLGTSMRSEESDNVLLFMVSYNVPVVRVVTPEQSMETLTLTLNYS